MNFLHKLAPPANQPSSTSSEEGDREKEKKKTKTESRQN